MAKLIDIEGIGKAYAEKLEKAGVVTIDDLLKQGGSSSGREKLAEAAGVTEKQMLEWVNRCDLMRLKGVGSEFADLLEAAGVDSVPELGQRNAANLQAKMAELNEKKNLVRRVPSESEIERWIEEAKGAEK